VIIKAHIQNTAREGHVDPDQSTRNSLNTQSTPLKV